MLLAADAVVAGVHCDLDLVGLDDMGWKALVANLSDVAAVGGRPLAAVVTVSGPLGEVDVGLLYDGLLAAAEVYRCPVVGGDLSSAPTLVVSVAIVGDAGPAVAAAGAALGRPARRRAVSSPGRWARRPPGWRCCGPGGPPRTPSWSWPTAGPGRGCPRGRRRGRRGRRP